MLNIDHIKITPRDEQVLQLLVQGCTNKEIASCCRPRRPQVAARVRNPGDRFCVQCNHPAGLILRA